MIIIKPELQIIVSNGIQTSGSDQRKSRRKKSFGKVNGNLVSAGSNSITVRTGIFRKCDSVFENAAGCVTAGRVRKKSAVSIYYEKLNTVKVAHRIKYRKNPGIYIRRFRSFSLSRVKSKIRSNAAGMRKAFRHA